MANEQDGVVWRRGSETFMNISDDDDTWDDTALIKAYDKAVANLKAGINNSKYQTTENSKKQNKKEKHKKKKSVKNKNKKWKVGEKCLSIFEDDGLYYQATILSINNEDQTALVQYDYYMNEDEISLSKLLPLEIKNQMEVVATNITNAHDSETKSISVSNKEEENSNRNEEVQSSSDVEFVSGWRVSDICYILNEKRGSYQKAVLNSFTTPDHCQVTLIKSNQKIEVKITQLHSTIPTQNQNSHRRKSRSPHNQSNYHQSSNQNFPFPLPDFAMQVPPPPPTFMNLPGLPPFSNDIFPWQKGSTNNLDTHLHSKFPPCPPLPVIPKDVISGNEEALANMLMSWYMSGYHTGYYQGIQQNQQTTNESKQNRGKRWNRKQTSD